jgi:hypothetical protein
MGCPFFTWARAFTWSVRRPETGVAIFCRASGLSSYLPAKDIVEATRRISARTVFSPMTFWTARGMERWGLGDERWEMGDE